jgi:heat shock protein HslJ
MKRKDDLMKPFSSGNSRGGGVSPAGLLAVLGLLVMVGLAIALASAGISVADGQLDSQRQVGAGDAGDDGKQSDGKQNDAAVSDGSREVVAGGDGQIDANHPLRRSIWLVEDLDNGGVIDRLRTYIRLDEAGQASGSTGMNRFNGEVTIEGNQIKFGKMATTRMGGSAAVMAQEAKFIKLLSKVRSYKIDENGLLRLLDGDGKERMRLAPEPIEEPAEEGSDRAE